MGICNEDCDCVVIGDVDRGILVTGTGDADTPFEVSTETDRSIPISVATRDDLPTLTLADWGTYSYVRDTGITFVWTGTEWQTVGPEWSRADIADQSIDIAAANSNGFVLAGSASFCIWGKGWIETEVPATTTVTFTVTIWRVDTAVVLDSISVDAANADAGPVTFSRPFALMQTLGLGPGDVAPIVMRYAVDNAPSSATLKYGRLFASRISDVDTTTAYP